MHEAIRYEGYWWLPGADENRVPGILEFDPDKGANLHLLGSLQGLKGIVDPIEPEIILGLSSDGKPLTLKDCAKTQGNLRFGSGSSTSAFAANTVLVGEHFEQPEDIGFERLVVEYLHLGAWADATGFDIKFIEETEEPKYVPDLPKEEHERRVQEILDAAPEEHRGGLERKLQVVSEPSLGQRLHEIFKRHRGIVESVIDKSKQVRADFIEKVVATRNYRTRFDDSKKDKAARGEELYKIMRRLNLVLEACLMEEIGFSPEKTEDAISGMR